MNLPAEFYHKLERTINADTRVEEIIDWALALKNKMKLDPLGGEEGECTIEWCLFDRHNELLKEHRAGLKALPVEWVRRRLVSELEGMGKRISADTTATELRRIAAVMEQSMNNQGLTCTEKGEEGLLDHLATYRNTCRW